MSQSNDLTQFLRELLALPAQERVGRLSQHLKSYALEDASQRAVLIRALLDAGGELSPAQRKDYMKLRASAVAAFPMGTQMAVLGSYREVLSQLPGDRARQERASLELALPELTGEERAAAERFMNYLPDAVKPDVGADAKKSARSWWKFWV